MNIRRQQKSYGLVIIILVILNLFTVGALWKMIGRKSLPPPRQSRVDQTDQGRNIIHFLVGELNLSESQKRELERIRHQHHQKREGLERRLLDMRRVLLKESINKKKDMTLVKQVSKNIGSLQAELEYLTFEHFIDIKSLCDEDQEKRFDLLLQEVFSRRPPPENGNRRPRRDSGRDIW